MQTVCRPKGVSSLIVLCLMFVCGLLVSFQALAEDAGQPAAPQAPAVDEAAVTNAVEDAAEPEPVLTNAVPEGPEAAYDNIELLTEVLLHIRDNYVDEKSITDITMGALHGMLRALDPHSDFLEAEAYDELREDTTGRFSGIGIHIGMRDGMLTVIAPIEGTPAFEAGLLAGDRILEINGKRTAGMSLQDAIDRLRGPRGEPVSVSIGRSGEKKPENVTIVRDDIEVPSVKDVRMVRDGVGYLRITQFAVPTAADVSEALGRLEAEGMQALVLDLRSNPGGLLKAAALVAQLFLDRGDPIVSTRGRAGQHDEQEIRAGGGEHHTGFPMAVLVNRGSASASEIVAGALKDNGRAVLVGEQTYGKASVQSLIRLKTDEAAAIRLTTAHYYTPGGAEIHEVGIEPDIMIEMEPLEWRRILIRRSHMQYPNAYSEAEKAEFADAVDVHLERAVDLLRAVVIFNAAGKK